MYAELKHSHQQYRVFRWLGPFPTYDQDLWNRTSLQKTHVGAFGIGLSAENVAKSQGICKKQCVGKNGCFSDFFFESMDDHAVPMKETLFFNFSNVSCVFVFAHAIFIVFLVCYIIISVLFFKCFASFFFPLLSSLSPALLCPATHTTHHTCTDTHHTPHTTHNTQHTQHTPPHGWLGN